MRSRKDIKQEKNEGSSEIFNMVEGIHSRRGYLGNKREFKKCRRVN